jgi:peptide/nickel transport system ATP-binding protein/oligopeptide transport system ATP-binding protein
MRERRSLNAGELTLGRALIGLNAPTSGSVTFAGKDVYRLPKAERRAMRRQMQIIFQDPLASLNPRMRAGEIIAEPLLLHRRVPTGRVRDRVMEILGDVRLASYHADRYPHQFSGGQRQRIGIARALACDPDIIVCDEPVSALDLSVRAQVMNLLMDLQRRLHLTYIFISHDLSLVQRISQNVAVMYLGKLVELGETQSVFEASLHPYTQALIAASPRPTPNRIVRATILQGDLPSPLAVPPGCRFHPRCLYAVDRCCAWLPTLEGSSPTHFSACHRKDELDLSADEFRYVSSSPGLRRRASLFGQSDSEQ